MNRPPRHEPRENTLILKPGREESLKRRHPWVFSGAIASVRGNPATGESVEVRSSDGAWLVSAAYSPHSQIRARVWSFAGGDKVDTGFLQSRIQRAIRARKHLLDDPGLTACRLIYAESDGLPGLIADRYGDFLVCQFLSAGAEYWKDHILQQLDEILQPEGIYERSDPDSRKKEGLELHSGTIRGKNPPDLIEIKENGLRFLVDVRQGHKTGFYLDQRDNRAQVERFSRGAEVLNCFSYTGGFGISALKGGASSATNIETSQEAVEQGIANAGLNGLERDFLTIQDDVFTVLRSFRDQGRSFDLVILDPPKFAASAGQVERASRGYKDINLLAMKLLRPGGTLFTFSCSGHIMPALFQKIVADAALDAKRDAQIVQYLGQADDHPIALNFPESQYLKGFIIKVF